MMRIVFDSSSNGHAAGAAALDWSHTAGIGSGRMLVVGIAIVDGDPLNMNLMSVKYGPSEMRYISDSAITAGQEGMFLRTLLYFLPGPASGPSPLLITTAGPCARISGVATSLANVYQGVPEAVAANRTAEDASDVTAYIGTTMENAWLVDVASTFATTVSNIKEIAQPGRNAISWAANAAGPIAISCAAFVPLTDKAPVSIAYDFASPQQAFGAARLERTLLQMSMRPIMVDAKDAAGTENLVVRVGMDPAIPSEGFEISVNAGTYLLQASDEAGAMYGLLEMSEKIQMHGLEHAGPVKVEARLPFRAIKHNTPWSSYRNDFAQDQHYHTMQDLTYWESFLNMMAENRYNTLTLWTQHPFPYMIRPVNFPAATPFADDALARWQFLYRSIFRMARERGIEVFLVNWNIFVSAAFKAHYDSKANADEAGYFGDAYTTPQIEQYTRECVTQVLNEYPDLAGFGFTLGEYMGGMTPVQREQWAMKTLIEGMKAADRPAKLIYRMPLSANTGSGGSTSTDVERMTRDSIESLTGLVLPIETETKFNWSHGYASTKLIQAHGGGISTAFWEPAPTKYRMDWMIRNEDFFTLRWGQTDFVREHIRANSQPYVGGYYIGSECYYPALNYIDLPNPADNRTRFAFERQWLLYMLWGRLLFDDKTPDRSFELAFDRRYGPGTGVSLLKAYTLASSYVQLFGSFIHTTWDFTSYAEGFLCPVMVGEYDDGKSPFLSLAELMDHKVLDSDYLSIKAYADGITGSQPIPAGKITPLELADKLDRNAGLALAGIRSLTGSHPALKDEVGDVMAWCCLGRYFAEKLRAGTALQMFTLTKDPEQKDLAVTHILAAKTHWLRLVSVTKPRYKPTRLIHIHDDFSWENYLGEVDRDIAVAQMST